MIQVTITIAEKPKLLDVHIETEETTATEIEKLYSDKLQELMRVILDVSGLVDIESPQSDIITEKKAVKGTGKQKLPAWENSQNRNSKKRSGRNGK